MVADICLEKKLNFPNVFLRRSTVAPRMEELPSDRNRQLGTKGQVHYMKWSVIYLSETS